MKKIVVGKGSKRYPILFAAHNDVAELVTSLIRTQEPASQSVVIIADATAHALYPKVVETLKKKLGGRVNIRINIVSLPSGERHKSGKHLLALLESAIAFGVDRSTTVVAFGGGVTTDIAGCVASLFLRGVRWIAVPTTFLGMVDAAIGGKTGVNSTQGKNLIGTFWPPEAVIVSSHFMHTQKKKDFTDSLAEAVKYYAISGAPSLGAIKSLQQGFPHADLDVANKVVQRCARIKAKIVTDDERESGARAFLNFGHTIGHALEFCGGYRSISHGRGVAAGMVGAIWLSVKAGLQKTSAIESLEAYCRSLSKGKRINIRVEAALAALAYDKKRRGGKLMFVLLNDIGKPYLHPAPDKRTLAKAVELSIQALVG